jgi:hypothetical protein
MALRNWRGESRGREEKRREEELRGSVFQFG